MYTYKGGKKGEERKHSFLYMFINQQKGTYIYMGEMCV